MRKARTVVGAAVAACALAPAGVSLAAWRLLEKRPLRTYLNAVRQQGKLYAPLESIPPEVLEIFVTREDPCFYRHKGILPKSMLRAALYGIRTGKPMPGGSTITQQLIKNLYLDGNRSLVRKAKELALALEAELGGQLTKDELLELYLNCVPYGPDVYGIADAAQFYFGKSASALTRNQAIILASIAPSPFYRRPIEDPIAFVRHRNNSLYELFAFGVLTRAEAKSLAHTYRPDLGLDPELRRLQDIYGVPSCAKTGDGLVAYAQAQIGASYWRGGYGQLSTLGLLNHSRWKWPDEYENLSYLDDLGKRVYDAAGLVKGFLWSSGLQARPCHDRKRDWTCAELYENAKVKGSMECFDCENGRLLYAASTPEGIDHVGVFCADGDSEGKDANGKAYVIHAKDRSSGVVCEPFRAQDWAFWSGLPAYSNDVLGTAYEARSTAC